MQSWIFSIIGNSYKNKNKVFKRILLLIKNELVTVKTFIMLQNIYISNKCCFNICTKKQLFYNCNISQFYCIFDQINAAMVNISDSFRKILKHLNYSKLLTIIPIFLSWSFTCKMNESNTTDYNIKIEWFIWASECGTLRFSFVHETDLNFILGSRSETRQNMHMTDRRSLDVPRSSVWHRR